MAERGKYHGQRLKARDVLRLYAAGERDFRGAILCGCNFRRADLSGANFSGADIRSTRFVDATLRGTIFGYAQAGLQRLCWLGQLLMFVLIAALSGILQAIFGAALGDFLVGSDLESSLIGISGIVSVFIIFLTITHQGFTPKILGSVAVVTATTCAIAGAIAITIAIVFGGSGSVVGVGSGTVAVASAVAVAISVAIVVSGTIAGSGAIAFATTATIAGITAIMTASVMAAYGTSSGSVSGAVASAAASFWICAHISSRVRKGDPKFEDLRITGLAFAALGGTTFSGVDLTEGTFAYANLKNTNFANSRQRHTILTRIRWHHAEKLDLARLGTSNLQDPRVRTLLTTLNGIDQDLSNADLRSANLAGAQLHRANLKGSKLNDAILQRAELHGANLTEAQCICTNFTAAQLTGACLEAWNIDETTVLKGIDCQYVFLKENPSTLGVRERLPHNPDKCFEPGDFEKYFQEVLDEVKILIRGGVDPQAFKVAFQELMHKHQITPENVRSVQRKGTDVLMSVAARPDQAKPDIARTFDAAYEKALPAAAAQALLEAERRHQQEFIDFADKSLDRISRVLSNLTIQNTAMTNSNNPNIATGDGSFYAGGDVTLTGSTLNLGEISGQVSNQINQLPDAVSKTNQPRLKDLLTQLKTAIDQDAELNDDEKAEALGEVAKLVKAGSNPKEGAMQRLAKRATTTLKAIAETLTDASKLATACKTLLPAIAALF